MSTKTKSSGRAERRSTDISISDTPWTGDDLSIAVFIEQALGVGLSHRFLIYFLCIKFSIHNPEDHTCQHQ